MGEGPAMLGSEEKLLGLFGFKDTHRPRTLRWFYA